MSDKNGTQTEPLMQNVDISEKEEDSDDLFSSAIDVSSGYTHLNLFTDTAPF